MKGKVVNFFEIYGKSIAVGLSLIVLIFSLIYIVREAIPKKLTVSFLDVGQGDAILVQTPSGHDMLIDGGPSDKVMMELSKKMGFFNRDIEVMIATHGDADHITGLIPVLEKYEVKNVVHSPIDATTDTFDDLTTHLEQEDEVSYVGSAGDRIEFGDGVAVHILYPRKKVSLKTKTNDASVSIVVTYGEHSFLLTGDLSGKYESHLIGKNLPRNITVYKAGHHGSKTSSGEYMLSYIKPEYTVISASKDNRYGHPNSETIARLEKHSQEILGTYDRGTISFISDGRTLTVETEK